MAYSNLVTIYDDLIGVTNNILPFPWYQEQQSDVQNVYGVRRFELREILTNTMGQGGLDRVYGMLKLFLVYPTGTVERDIIGYYDLLRTNVQPGQRYGTNNDLLITQIEYQASVISGLSRLDEIDVLWEADLARN